MVTISACKSDKKKEATEEIIKETPKVEIIKEENIIVTLNAVVPNDDTFILQYTEDAGFKYRPKDIVKVNITGSNVPQDIVFKLPNKIFPTKFMLKVGTNNMKDVAIQSIYFNNEEREFKVNNNNFFQFLNTNKFIDYDRENKTYTAKKIDNNFLPTFTSRPILIQRLEEKVF
jgi:hypothetical protein